MNRWLQREDVPRGADYDARWTSLAASGANVHGEADLVTWCLAERHVPAEGHVPAEAAHAAPTRRRPRVLDAGCGTGRVAIELERRGLDVVGVDIDPAMLGPGLGQHGRVDVDADHVEAASLQLDGHPRAPGSRLTSPPCSSMTAGAGAASI